MKHIRKRAVAFLLLFALLCSSLTDVKVYADAVEQPAAEQLSEEQADARASDVPVREEDVNFYEIEWGLHPQQNLKADTVRKNEIVLLLDVSGSMSGTPMEQLKKACYNFVDDILSEDAGAGISIVTFESNVRAYTFEGDYFTSNRNELRSVISGLDAGGGTAMNEGLKKADEILFQHATASNKFIIQMTDGEPNGDTYYGADAKYSGGEYVDPDGNPFTYTSNACCSAIYNTYLGIEKLYHIYSLGFFHSMSGREKQFAATFMNDIQNSHYFEVTDADKLTFSFEDIAENINSDVIFFNKSSLALQSGSTEQLSVMFSSSYPSADKTVSWTSGNEKVAVVSVTGKVTGVGAGNTVITAEAGGYKIRCPITVTAQKDKIPVETIGILIEENLNTQSSSDKYKASAGAKVTYDGKDYVADAKGKVTIPKISKGEISISKSGYMTRNVAARYVKDGAVYRIQKETENPVINAVWVRGKDLLAEEFEVSLDKSTTILVAADIDWGQSGRGKLQLGQEATFVDFSSSSDSLSLVIQSKFDVTKDIYLIATNAAGNTTKKKLQFTVSSKIKGIEGFSLDVGDKIGLTLPEDIPLIGGSEIGLDLGDDNDVLPVSVAVTDGKIHIAIGLDMASYSKENDEEAEKTVLGFIEDIKNFKKLKNSTVEAARELKNIKQKYRESLQERKGKFGVDAGVTITGYMDCYMDGNGNLRIIESGLVLGIEAEVSWSGNAVVEVIVVPVPVYWEAAISGEVQGLLSLSYSGADAKYVPGGQISATLEGTIGGGLGNTNVATIGGGGKASLSPSVTFYKDKKNYFALTTSINFYFKLTALGIYEKTWEPDCLGASWTIDNGVESVKNTKGDALNLEDMYQADAYDQSDLSYLLEGKTLMKQETAADDTFFAQNQMIFTDNAITQTAPQLESFEDGTKIAVWMDASQDDANTVKLYYAFYDGVSWSSPAAVEEDDTADFNPRLYVSGHKAYVVWQDARTKIEKDSTLEDVVEMQIKAAVFDNNRKAFEEAVVLNKQADTLPMMPVIAGDKDVIVAGWVENSDKDWFGTKGSNTIYSCTYEDGSWSEPAAVKEGAKAIVSVAADVKDGSSYFAYTMDEDNDLNTTNDQEVYVNQSQITQNEWQDAQVSFADHMLYWMRNGNVYYTEDLTEVKEQAVLEAGSELPFYNYQVVTDGKKKAVLFVVKDELKSSICGAFYQEDGWGSVISLTNPEDAVDITAFSAEWSSTHSLELLCNKVEVTGELPDEEIDAEEAEEYYKNLYGKTSLSFMEYEDSQTTGITEIYYEKEQIMPESILPVTASVTNHSMSTISGITLEVYADGQKVQEMDVNTQLLSGESREVTINCVLKDAYIGKKLTLVCMPLKGAELATDSSVDIELSYEDIALENVKWTTKDENTVWIMGDLKNLGYSDTSQMEVQLRKDSREGEIVNKFTVEQLGSCEKTEVLFEAPYQEDMVYYVTAAVPQTDMKAGNDADYVVLKGAQENTGHQLQSITASLDKTTYQTGDKLDVSGIKVVAVYDDASKADVTAEAEIDISGVDMNQPGDYKLKVSFQGAAAELVIKVLAQKQNDADSSDTGNNTENSNTGNADSSGQEDNSAAKDNQEQTDVKVGDKKTIGKLVYKVTSTKEGNGTVTVCGCTDKSSRKKLKVPATVTIDKKTYKVTQIGKAAFSGCKKLSEITVGDYVVTIDANAFAKCTALKSVTLGSGVKTIKTGAFSGCKKLNKVTVKTKKLAAVQKNAFKGIAAKAKIKVPAAKYKNYKKLFTKKTVGYKKTWKISK